MKALMGKVVSDKMVKSASVEVTQTWTHPKYKKTIKKTKKFIADNQLGAHVGDTVELTETRPLSHRKRFSITKIIQSTNLDTTELNTAL